MKSLRLKQLLSIFASSSASSSLQHQHYTLLTRVHINLLQFLLWRLLLVELLLRQIRDDTYDCNARISKKERKKEITQPASGQLTWLFIGSVLIWHIYSPSSSFCTLFICRFHVVWSLWDTETLLLCVITWSWIAWIALVSTFSQPTCGHIYPSKEIQFRKTRTQSQLEKNLTRRQYWNLDRASHLRFFAQLHAMSFVIYRINTSDYNETAFPRWAIFD